MSKHSSEQAGLTTSTVSNRNYTPTVVIITFFISAFIISCAATQPPHYIPISKNEVPSSDLSHAGPDGPFVLYRNGKIVVKSVYMDDTIAKVRKEIFTQKKEVLLTCKVASTGDAFSFGLKDSIMMPPSIYPDLPARVLALSDIEGDFSALKTMLLGAHVIDDRFNWTFGKGHLVLLGDYFDRGTEVTQCLWLIYKLETEAAAAGGCIHFILGNHEVMNLSGDQRYVRNKYFENADLIGEPYIKWYATDSELGIWLRSKNAIEKIGDNLFCHGGLHTDLATSRMGIEDINRIARRWYGTPESKITDPDAQLIFSSSKGIFWYRDMAKNKLDKTTVAETLARYNAKKVILGHTLQPEVTSYYNGKVICIDLYHEENLRVGNMRTLLIENGLFYCLNAKGDQTSIMNTRAIESSKGDEE